MSLIKTNQFNLTGSQNTPNKLRNETLRSLTEKLSTERQYTVFGVSISRPIVELEEPKTIREYMFRYCDRVGSDQILLPFFPYMLKIGQKEYDNLPKYITETIHPDNIVFYNNFTYFRSECDASLVKLYRDWV